MRRIPVLPALILVLACAAEREQEPEPRPGPPVPKMAGTQRSRAVGPSASVAARGRPSPSATEADPYDLSSDLQRRREVAKDEIGRFESEVVEDVFLIVAPGKRASLAGSIDVTKRALAAYFNGRFEKRPARAISVYLFPASDGYDAYCKKRWQERCDSPYGFYLSSERKIIMNVGLGIGTLTHELVHPLVEADFPGAPDWLNEGIASLFEQFYLPRSGEIHGGKNWRHPRLIQGLASQADADHTGLPALFGMSDEVFRGDKEDLHYATARYLCQWLDEKKLLWSFYQRWRDGHASDPTGEKSFAAVVGMTPAQADGAWRRWVRAL